MLIFENVMIKVYHLHAQEAIQQCRYESLEHG